MSSPHSLTILMLLLLLIISNSLLIVAGGILNQNERGLLQEIAQVTTGSEATLVTSELLHVKDSTNRHFHAFSSSSSSSAKSSRKSTETSSSSAENGIQEEEEDVESPFKESHKKLPKEKGGASNEKQEDEEDIRNSTSEYKDILKTTTTTTLRPSELLLRRSIKVMDVKDYSDFKGTVGFSAVGAKKLSSSTKKQRILFETTLTDLNFGWDSRRSAFKCAYPGLYFFTFSAVGIAENPKDSQWKISLVLNGVEVVSTGSQSQCSASNSLLLPLNKNDQIWLQLNEGSLLVEEEGEKSESTSIGQTSFSGYRVGSISKRDIDPNYVDQEEEEEERPEVITSDDVIDRYYYDNNNNNQDRRRTTTTRTTPRAPTTYYNYNNNDDNNGLKNRVKSFYSKPFSSSSRNGLIHYPNNFNRKSSADNYYYPITTSTDPFYNPWSPTTNRYQLNRLNYSRWKPAAADSSRVNFVNRHNNDNNIPYTSLRTGYHSL